MKIIVDAAVCQGHGECVLVAPELFDLGDDTGAVNVHDDVPEELQEEARQAERVCPLGAISIEE
jgi:ferredoxin